MMTNTMFSGKIKYLGDSSSSQDFKAAKVSVSVEDGRLYLETRLHCNPARVYKRNEITGAEVKFRTNRVIIKYTVGRQYWEIHFVGDAKSTSQQLFDDIQSSLKANSKTPPSKAEVGSEKKTSSALNRWPSKMDQGWQPLEGSSSMDQEAPCPAGQKLQSGSSPANEDLESSASSLTSQESSSPVYPDTTRGPVAQIVNQQNKPGNCKPLQISGVSFYGPQRKLSLDKIVPSNRFFNMTKSRSEPSTSAPGGSRRLGQLSEVVNVKSYSWNNGKSPPGAQKDTTVLQGFANLGNTCYMNAILQCLFGLDTFSMDLHSVCRHYCKVLTKQSLAVALTRLMLTKQRPQNSSTEKVEELLIGVKLAISTSAKRFIGSQQHDAHEFLYQVLDQLKEEVIKLSKPKTQRKDAGEDEKQMKEDVVRLPKPKTETKDSGEDEKQMKEEVVRLPKPKTETKDSGEDENWLKGVVVILPKHKPETKDAGEDENQLKEEVVRLPKPKPETKDAGEDENQLKEEVVVLPRTETKDAGEDEKQLKEEVVILPIPKPETKDSGEDEKQLKEEVVMLPDPKTETKHAGGERNKTSSSAAQSPDTTNSTVDAASSSRSTPLSKLMPTQDMCKSTPRVNRVSPMPSSTDSPSATYSAKATRPDDFNDNATTMPAAASSEFTTTPGGSKCTSATRPGSGSNNIATRPVCNDLSTPKQQSDSVSSVKESLPPDPLVNPTFNNFEFEVVHSFCCINCLEMIQKVEQFNGLSVDIPKSNNVPLVALTLQDALDIYFLKEEIEFWCEKCDQYSKALVTHKFAKLPRILILHLKRYTAWNKKVQRQLQLPRYITLQDHCDNSTVPHLPYSIMQLCSPLDSLLSFSPVKQPAAATPENRQRRQRPFPKEKGTSQGNKKVRRVLLSDVQGETSQPIKKPRTSWGCEESATKEHTKIKRSKPEKPRTSWDCEESATKEHTKIKRSKPEVIALKMDTEENSDFELQRVIDLSLQEYQQSQNPADNNNSATGQQGASTSYEEEEDLDYDSMPFEKQLELALKRSLHYGPAPADSELEGSENLGCQKVTVDSHPPADESVFKMPLSPPKKENKRMDSQASVESSVTAVVAPVSFGRSEIDMSMIGVRNFTSASDFMIDAEIRHNSPDKGDCDVGLGSCSQAFTVFEHLHDTMQAVPTVPGSTMSTNIGSLGALSTRMEEDDFDVKEKSKHDWMLEGEREALLLQGCCSPATITPLSITPMSSPDWSDDSGDDFAPQKMVTDVLAPKEKKQTDEALKDDWMETSDVKDVLNQGKKREMEEKENRMPVTENNKSQKTAAESAGTSANKEAGAKLSVNMEAAAKLHELRHAEIEKGTLPHTYRLVSIVNHHGQSSNSGHYMSDVYDIKKQAWFNFDDTNVIKTTEPFVRSNRTTTGYIFFYMSKDIVDDIEATRLVERN